MIQTGWKAVFAMVKRTVIVKLQNFAAASKMNVDYTIEIAVLLYSFEVEAYL